MQAVRNNTLWKLEIDSTFSQDAEVVISETMFSAQKTALD